MRIKLINPNTTVSMTETMWRSVTPLLAPGTELVAATSLRGPVSIECHYDEALAVPGLLEQIVAGEREGCDAYVIACFGDPGLHAARELARGPVIGIAEAAMHAATVVAPGFSVVTTLERTIGTARHLVERYGAGRFCKSIRAVEIPVLALDGDEAGAVRAYDAVHAEAGRAIAQDGAEAIVLGCAGMTHWTARLSASLGVPVIDGVSTAVKWAEAMVSLGLQTSKRGEFALPNAKAD